MIDFVHDVRWQEIPAEVRDRATLLLRDFAAVSVAGRATATAAYAADYAAAQHAGDAATALFDGRRLAPAGAAWANGVLANALDFDDGHRLVKGHPGANVIPAALALAETVDAAPEDLLSAVVVGYEVALRAGIDLHARSSEYHASGAWGSLGAAAAAARLLGLDAGKTRHALGLAEYHAPIAPVMRSVGDPAMTKDACGWGAFVGVSSALLAEAGFTAAAAAFLERAPADLNQRWHLLDVYVKKFPCCRWSHPAIEAALVARSRGGLEPDGIRRVRILTFAAAAALARRSPATTEEAQYSLVWPVAVALVHGDFTVDHVGERALRDPVALRLASLVEVEVEPELEAEFPARRRARVVVDDFASGVTEAPGEPDDTAWAQIVEAKFRRFAANECRRSADDPGALARLVAAYEAGRRSSASAMS